jgi:Tfp pilus assembly protein PilF
MKFAFAVLYFILCVACASKTIDQEAALLHMKIGTGFLNKGAYAQALEELTKAHNMSPNNSLIINNLGVAYFALEQYEKSEAHFRRALTLSPKFTDARNNLARVLIEQKRYNDAFAELNAVKKDLTYPYLDKMWLNYGLGHFYQQSYLSAKDSFTNALKINRRACLANVYYGQTLFHLRQYTEATQALDSAVEFCENVNNAEPYFYSAKAYLQLGNRDKALARLEEVIRRDPHGIYSNEANTIIKKLKE